MWFTLINSINHRISVWWFQTIWFRFTFNMVILYVLESRNVGFCLLNRNAFPLPKFVTTQLYSDLFVYSKNNLRVGLGGNCFQTETFFWIGNRISKIMNQLNNKSNNMHYIIVHWKKKSNDGLDMKSDKKNQINECSKINNSYASINCTVDIETNKRNKFKMSIVLKGMNEIQPVFVTSSARGILYHEIIIKRRKKTLLEMNEIKSFEIKK